MRRATIVLAVLAVAATFVAPAGAQAGRDYERIDVSRIDARLTAALTDPDRLLTVVLEMEGAPVAVSQGEALTAGRVLSRDERAAIRADLKGRQDAIKSKITGLDGNVLSQFQDAFNGIKVRVPASSIQGLAAIAGVVKVHALEQHYPTNAVAVPFLGVPGVWESFGYTGSGVSVGIIDTGVDYLHANFGGSGDPAEFAANDPTVIEPGTFPTAKVVGGYDFVGDAYDASSTDPALYTPVPDPDPLDCNGHGSHVAGSAAGFGVLADGSTYPGPYDTSTHSNSFLIGPGVAPEASIYALKVFGCDGSTDVVVDALDWAVENDIDVVNMSLGSPFGRKDDPSAIASTNAALAGVVVVASAGNSGPSPYITGSPATAVGAISVAAMDTIESTPHANVVGATDTIDTQNSNGADLSTPITGTLLVVEDDPATTDIDESLGCNESDYPENTAGNIPVTVRGTCARVDRAIHGQALGAAAVIMINNDVGFPPYEGPIVGVTIPFLGALQEDAPRFDALNGQEVTIEDGGVVANPGYLGFASFSSGGPRNGDSGAKPDVIAPGVSIISTASGTGSGAAQISGTSMSSPMVAGVAALTVQAHPGWRVEDIKAAIIGTSDPNLMVGYLTTRAGAGVVQPASAVNTQVVAVTNPLEASLSFGFDESTGTITDTKVFEVRNHGNANAGFALSSEWNTDAGGAASISTSPSSITVPARGRVLVEATLTVDGPAVPTGFQTASGNLVLTPTAGAEETLRVPFVMVAKGDSSLSTTPRRVVLARGDNRAEFTTTNAAGATGTFDVYSWGQSDPRDAGGGTDVKAVGVQSFPDFDIGVFAINTYERNSNPAVNEWDVLLDVDQDGAFDYGVIGFDLGAVFTGTFDGTLASLTIDLNTGEILAAFLAGGGLDTSTVLLPFPLSTVGLNAGNGGFDYISAVFSLEGFADDTVDGVGAFNAFNQPVETGQFGELAATESAPWTSAVSRPSLANNPVKGWMIVELEDHTRNQTELIGLTVR